MKSELKSCQCNKLKYNDNIFRIKNPNETKKNVLALAQSSIINKLKKAIYKFYPFQKINKCLYLEIIMARISASILGFLFDSRNRRESSDVMIARINKALKEREKDFDILHFDIEDGKFVKYKSFRPSEIRKIKCKQKKEAHFMVINYKRYIKDFYPLVDMFIFHQEILKRDFPKTIDFLKKNKKFVGIAINPETHIDEMKYFDKIDLVLVMSIHPGAPGQKFLDSALWKVKKLKEIREKRRLRFKIEVDGGINKDNMKKVIDAGADILEMGTGFFTRK